MNIYTFTGNLGGDGELREAGGTPVLNFNVAVKTGYGNNEETMWVGVALWGKRAESLAQYVRKGEKIGVAGELLPPRIHKDKAYTSVRALDVTLLGGGQASSGQASGGFRDKPDESAADVADDDIPF